MKNTLLLVVTLLLYINSLGQFKNIKLLEQDDQGYPPVEPSITINKKNTKNIVAAAVLDWVIVSNDGGETWNKSHLKSPSGVYGDPALISNFKGHLFYFHLADPSGKGRSDDAWLDRIVCHTSEDEGATWNEGVTIGNNPPADQDKAWPAIHPKRNSVYVTWTQFDKYGSSDSTCHSNIMFSKALFGNKFSKAISINETPGDCLDKDDTTEGAVPAVGNDGKIYVAWANHGKIYFDRSYDDGNTWLSNDLLITKQEGGWDLDIPGIQRSNGLPVLTIDNSASRFQGTLYLLWADQKNGTNNTDIWLMRSRNRGDYWSKPLRINKDEGEHHQFFPWITVDQTNGNVYIVYYDRRNYNDSRTDVYLAYSFDGGNTFDEMKISDEPFIPDASKFFGDYTNIDAHGGIITPIWTRMDNGRTSVWTSVIKEKDLPKPTAPIKKK